MKYLFKIFTTITFTISVCFIAYLFRTEGSSDVISKQNTLAAETRHVISNDEEKLAIETANRELQSFLQKIPQGCESLYGFNNREEFSAANVGTPFRVYTLAEEFVKNTVLPLKDFLIPLDNWRVAVVVDGKYRTLLTVSNAGGIWHAVDLGGSGLAGELQSIERLFDSSNKLKIILRLFQIQCDFVLSAPGISDINYAGVYPLESARIAFDELNKPIQVQYSLEQLAPMIRSKYSGLYKNNNQ